MPKLLHKLKVPLIGIELPEVSLPEIPPKPPKLDERQVEALRFAAMDDISDVFPFVGDIGSDLAFAELKKKLTPDEYEKFVEENKLLPSFLATVKTFAGKA